MFHPNTSLKLLDPVERQVHALHTCINQPTVSLEGAQAAPTFAFICGVWTKNHKAIEPIIMLFQPKNDLALFYQHENGPVSEDEYWQLENDALNFTDSMGFMMDNLFFGDLNEVQQQEVVYNLPPFMTNRKLYQATQPISVATPKEPEKTTVELEAGQPKFVELDAEAEVILANNDDADEPVGDSIFAGLEIQESVSDEPFADNLEFFERSEIPPLPKLPPVVTPPVIAPEPPDATPGAINDAAITPEYVRLLTAF